VCVSDVGMGLRELARSGLTVRPCQKCRRLQESLLRRMIWRGGVSRFWDLVVFCEPKSASLRNELYKTLINQLYNCGNKSIYADFDVYTMLKISKQLVLSLLSLSVDDSSTTVLAKVISRDS